MTEAVKCSRCGRFKEETGTTTINLPDGFYRDDMYVHIPSRYSVCDSCCEVLEKKLRGLFSFMKEDEK